eukprot:5754008-Amphidinium_carterae.1
MARGLSILSCGLVVILVLLGLRLFLNERSIDDFTSADIALDTLPAGSLQGFENVHDEKMDAWDELVSEMIYLPKYFPEQPSVDDEAENVRWGDVDGGNIER